MSTWFTIGRQDSRSRTSASSRSHRRRGRVLRGQTIRIVDLEGNQSGDCILYNADDHAEQL